MSLVLRIQQQFIRYIGRNRGPLKPPLELHYRQIFILPGRFGAGFSVLLLLILTAGLNFNNNMILMLGYLLLVLFLFSSQLAYRNLRGLRIRGGKISPVFAGEQALYPVCLGSSRQSHLAVEVWCDGKRQDQGSVQRQREQVLYISKATEQRGFLTLEAYKLQSAWPFGFFRAWSWLLPEARCLVYPRPAVEPPPLPYASNSETKHPDPARHSDELQSLREYQGGDPLNRIAWKTSARQENLISRVNESPQATDLELDWDALNGVETEQRLSILCAWALQAENSGQSWSLLLPGEVLEPGRGHEHLHSALRKLALFRLDTDTS